MATNDEVHITTRAQPTWVENKGPQVDAPYNGAAEMAFAAAVESLWQRNGNRYSDYYPDPDQAPTATITSFNSVTSFLAESTESVTWALPWEMAPGATAIEARLIVAYDDLPSELFMRLQTSTFLDSVTTSTGNWVFVPKTNFGPNNLWSRQPKFWKYGSLMLRINSPNLPSNRRVLLTPQCDLNVVTDPFQMSFSSTVKCYSIAIRDVYESTDPSV